MPAGIRLGFGVGPLQGVVLADVNPARPSELIPLGEELAVRPENFQPMIHAIGHEETPLCIEDDGVRLVDIAWA
jgi:hypothetical protein